MSIDLVTRHEAEIAVLRERVDNHDNVIEKLADSTDAAVQEVRALKDTIASSSISIVKAVAGTGLGAVLLLVLERLVG